MATLLKIDRNGTKYFEGNVSCTITGTIKEHSIYKDEKQTRIARVKEAKNENI